jgi:tetratricopeptide (TPR) repeat protein
MTTRRTEPETQSPLERFEARAERVFDWITHHPRHVLIGLGAAALVGLLGSGIYEWRDRAESSAQEALGKVERRFAESLGGDPRLVNPPEPANAEEARQSREQALAGFQSVVADHPRSRAADFAHLRAAEVEIDLGQLDASIARTDALAAALGTDDPIRALALRLLGYAHSQRGEFLEAGAAYARGAAVESYPDRGGLWLVAAASFERAGAPHRAIQAYQEVLAVDPDFGEREGVVDRLASLETRSAPAVEVPPAPLELEIEPPPDPDSP